MSTVDPAPAVIVPPIDASLPTTASDDNIDIDMETMVSIQRNAEIEFMCMFLSIVGACFVVCLLFCQFLTGALTVCG
jgi:hypothetical protein